MGRGNRRVKAVEATERSRVVDATVARGRCGYDRGPGKQHLSGAERRSSEQRKRPEGQSGSSLGGGVSAGGRASEWKPLGLCTGGLR